ncbi:hypothetical protein EVG20_g11090, partial [Dentipellis fragilis]
GVETPQPPAVPDTYRIHDPAILSRWRFDSQGGPPSALLKYTYVIEYRTDMYEAASRFLNLLQRTKGAQLGHFYDAEFITLFPAMELTLTLH